MAKFVGTSGPDHLVGPGSTRHDPGSAGMTGLFGLAGRDRLFGGSGNDWLAGGLAGDQLDGGAGWDIAHYWEATSGLRADLERPDTNTGEAKGDIYSRIEALGGTAFDDLLGGDAGPNTLWMGWRMTVWTDGRERLAERRPGCGPPERRRGD